MKWSSNTNFLFRGVVVSQVQSLLPYPRELKYKVLILYRSRQEALFLLQGYEIIVQKQNRRSNQLPSKLMIIKFSMINFLRSQYLSLNIKELSRQMCLNLMIMQENHSILCAKNQLPSKYQLIKKIHQKNNLHFCSSRFRKTQIMTWV